MTGRTPVSVRARATATLHPGTFSDPAGTLEGNGAGAADVAAGRLAGWAGAGGRAGAGTVVHEASNATAPDVADTVSVRAIPVFTVSA
jgi:hypothetical protein